MMSGGIKRNKKDQNKPQKQVFNKENSLACSEIMITIIFEQLLCAVFYGLINSHICGCFHWQIHLNNYGECVLCSDLFWQWHLIMGEADTLHLLKPISYFYLAVLGLSCGMQQLRSSLCHTGSSLCLCGIFSWSRWDLVPWSGIEPGPLTLGM